MDRCGREGQDSTVGGGEGAFTGTSGVIWHERGTNRTTVCTPGRLGHRRKRKKTVEIVVCRVDVVGAGRSGSQTQLVSSRHYLRQGGWPKRARVESSLVRRSAAVYRPSLRDGLGRLALAPGGDSLLGGALAGGLV